MPINATQDTTRDPGRDHVLSPLPLFRVEARTDLGQQCLRVLADVPAGTVLASFAASRRVAEATYLTVQLDAATHLALEPSFLEKVNHSCAPNVAFDMAELVLVALIPLQNGDELTYFYPSTEWSMRQPFTCACGAAACLGRIEGSAFMSREQLERYALSPFVRASLATHPRVSRPHTP